MGIWLERGKAGDREHATAVGGLGGINGLREACGPDMWGPQQGSWRWRSGESREEMMSKMYFAMGHPRGLERKRKLSSALCGLLCSQGAELRLTFIEVILHLCYALNRFSWARLEPSLL